MLPRPKSKDQIEKEERERREKDKKATVDKKLADEIQRLADKTGGLGFYTGLLALFTLLLFVAAVGQVGLIWRQLRLIKDSAKDTAETAKAAKATAEANRLAQRAYISVEPDGIRPFRRRREGTPVGADELLLAHFVIHNAGKVPAAEVNWFVQITFDERRDWRDFDFEEVGFVGDMMVAPDARISRVHRLKLTLNFFFLLVSRAVNRKRGELSHARPLFKCRCCHAHDNGQIRLGFRSRPSIPHKRAIWEAVALRVCCDRVRGYPLFFQTWSFGQHRRWHCLAQLVRDPSRRSSPQSSAPARGWPRA